MTITKHILHTARLNNNCPECFANDGLEFNFSQKETDTKFYKKANPIIEKILFCHSCNTNIYPVRWDNDIERVYEYHKKLAVPRIIGIQLKPISYMLILLGVIVVVAIGYLLIASRI